MLAAALLIGFSAFALYYRLRSWATPKDLECGCFGGIIASQLGVTTALRNLALLVPTFMVFFGYRQASVRLNQLRSLEQVGVTG